MSERLVQLSRTTRILDGFFGMRVYSVTELNVIVRKALEAEDKLFDVWVKGEILDCKLYETSGHLYFSIKDDSSRIKCVMFRDRNSALKFKPEKGMKIIARGSVGVYQPKGEYQLTVVEMQPEGLGAIYLAFLQTKEKLENEGLFDQTRKRRLPAFPNHIGVVTSPQGAVIRDIVNVATRRFHQINITIVPARVQGEFAEEELCNGIKALNELPGVDVIIVARGGGSTEELWVFNSERLARAIASSKIPVISAVGHETDVTIADYVADVRAPTPSAAAELAVPDAVEIAKKIDVFKSMLENAM